jgi:hypothetical protein
MTERSIELEIGLAADGRIVLRCSDAGVEIALSLEAARKLVGHLDQVIAVAASLPAGRRICMQEGRA